MFLERDMVAKVLTVMMAIGLAYVLFSIAMENQANESTAKIMASPFWLCGVVVIAMTTIFIVGVKKKVKHAKTKC